MKKNLLSFFFVLSVIAGKAQVYEIQTVQVWDGNAYQNDRRYSTLFDNSCMFQSCLTEAWDIQSNAWVAGTLDSIFTCNVNGTPLLECILSWNKNSGSFENSNRLTYLYNASGKESTRLTESWVNGGWENQSIDSSFYNNINLVSGSRYYSWVPATNSWRHDSYMNHTYAADSTETSFENYYFTGIPIRYTYIYNNFKKPIQLIVQNYMNASWENSTLFNFEYDAARALSKEELKVWNTASNSWMNHDVYEYTNDNTGRHNISLNTEWNNATGAYAESHKTTYIGGCQRTTGVKDITASSANNFSVTPNPASGLLTIKAEKTEIKNIDLFNEAGQKVISKAGNTTAGSRLQTDIDISLLPPGLYVVKVNDGAVLSSVKVVKQ
ncbi:MAG: T9SS type A sorting domain-containing protein [Bacteroidota bacterium]